MSCSKTHQACCLLLQVTEKRFTHPEYHARSLNSIVDIQSIFTYSARLKLSTLLGRTPHDFLGNLKFPSFYLW
jgi:hypothetical protein